MSIIIVLNNPQNFPVKIPNVTVISANSYLLDSEFNSVKGLKIFNLCKSYKYQSFGYYVSLLAAARGHKCFPNISTLQEVKYATLIRVISQEIDELINKSLKKLQSTKFELSIYFGKNVAKKYDKLSLNIFNLFPVPLIRIFFVKKKKWLLNNIQILSYSDVPEEHYPYLTEFASEYFKKKKFAKKSSKNNPFDLAILLDEAEKMPPSNTKAIKKFVKAGENLGLNVKIISKDDYHRIPEFDGLFIRETTNVNHHTFKFAQRAESEGLVVLDDPVSIIKCTNKVYISELFKKNNIPSPKTIILHSKNINSVPIFLNFPMILKKPDSSFSQGVVKVENINELKFEAKFFFEKSDLLIVQEFMPTEYDWRIGILDNKILYVCKYFMANKHWQIVNWNSKTKYRTGGFQCVAVNEVPKQIIKTALKAAKLIGKGLYGVDLKFVNNKSYVIEINDNPSIDAEVEDFIVKDKLYNNIMNYFFEKIVSKKEIKLK